MKYLVDSKAMKSCDTATIHYFGVPGVVLMERAALSIVDFMTEKRIKKEKVLIVCGTGNNGGDGMAIGRILAEQGFKPTVILVGNPEKLTKEASLQKKILENYKIKIESSIPANEYTTIIDALFGIGLIRDIEGVYQDTICAMNEFQGCKIAVDIPSGISADNGAVLGIAFKADYTVTFGYSKIGLNLYPGCSYCGQIVVKDIGISKESFLGKVPTTFTYTLQDLLELPVRRFYSNKGTYGKVLIIAGGKNMCGAAYLAGKAAYHSGCGLVKIFTSPDNRMILQTNLPEAVITSYENLEDLENSLIDAMEDTDAIAIGPGCGNNNITRTMLEVVLKNTKVPVIIDADGLNVLAQGKEILIETKQPIILTPHLGEMARLKMDYVSKIQGNLLETANDWVKKYKGVLVLKDARTVVTDASGRCYINTSGNNGMATAGAGDVLTGIIVSLLGQGETPFKAATLGVYLHGLSGDSAKEKYGTYSLMASHIIECISEVLKEITA